MTKREAILDTLERQSDEIARLRADRLRLTAQNALLRQMLADALHADGLTLTTDARCPSSPTPPPRSRSSSTPSAAPPSAR